MTNDYELKQGAIEKSHSEIGVIGENLLDDAIITLWDGRQVRQHSEPLLRHYKKRG